MRPTEAVSVHGDSARPSPAFRSAGFRSRAFPSRPMAHTCLSGDAVDARSRARCRSQSAWLGDTVVGRWVTSTRASRTDMHCWPGGDTRTAALPAGSIYTQAEPRAMCGGLDQSLRIEAVCSPSSRPPPPLPTAAAFHPACFSEVGSYKQSSLEEEPRSRLYSGGTHWPMNICGVPPLCPALCSGSRKNNCYD